MASQFTEHGVGVPDGLRERQKSVAAIQMTDEHGRRKTVHLDDLTDADRELAQKFGYNPVFKREFGYLACFSFAVSISGLFATTATTFIYPLTSGGASAVVWCWFISGLGCLCIAFSVAEIVSAYPTCGGLYFSVSRLAPPEWVPSISWITGWLNLLGQIAGVASSEYGSAQLLLAAVSMGTDFTYLPTNRQTVGVMAALTMLAGAVNALPTVWMEKLTRTYVIFHVAVLLCGAVALLAMTKDKHSASYVFGHVESTTGWTTIGPIGWSWLFGFLSVSWTMTDYDATAHIAEEISEPELKAPWAISMAMVFTYVAGWLYNIVLAFCMGNPEEILASPVAQPVAQIYFNSLGKSGGIAFTVFAVIILQFVCWTALQATARTFFAFSRDKLIPWSYLWTKIERRTGIPQNAVWLSTVLCILINLVGLGSYIAISGVFNVCAIALDISYAIPIACKIIFNRFEPGPWHLGKVGKLVNAWACIWVSFVTIIFLMPTAIPATAANMNYAIAFLGGIFIAATVYWFVSGKKNYVGPLTEAQVVDDISEPETQADTKKMDTV